MMRRFRTIAAVLAVLLPLGTPAAAWAGEQCCASGPLAALATSVATSDGPCHEASLPAATPAEERHVGSEDTAASDGCRMDHLGLRASTHLSDHGAAVYRLASAPMAAGPLAALTRAAAADRGPPPTADFTILNGILRI